MHVVLLAPIATADVDADPNTIDAVDDTVDNINREI